MNVLYILGRFPALSETFILNEIIEVINHGHNVYIVSLTLPDDEIVHDDFKIVQDKTIYLNKIPLLCKVAEFCCCLLRSPASVVDVLRSCYREDCWKRAVPMRLINASFLARYAKRCKIEHIHSHFANEPTSYAMWTSMLTMIPYTFTAHGYDIFREPPANYAEKAQRSKIMITISTFNKEYLVKEIGIDEKKIVVNRCGVNVHDFVSKRSENLGEDVPILLTVARLHPIKGLEYLVEAYRILKSSGIEFKGIIIGEGEERKRLEYLISKFGLGNKVSLVGPKTQAQVRAYLKRSAIFVLPSRSEGLPVVIMEAFASGLPVIASDIAGIPEILHDGKSGYLVPVGNPKLLAERMKELVLNRKKRKSFGEYGRKHVERNFFIKKQVDSLISIWKR